MYELISIGLPKGVNKKISTELISHYCNGFGVDGALSAESRSGIRFFLLKNRDIPELVYSGVLDFGVASEEWMVESGYEMEVLQKLDWCDTRISLISHLNNVEKCIPHGEIVFTEYPNISRTYFTGIGRSDIQLKTLHGSTEATVPLLSRYCIDCVETGNTLEKNGLIERETLLACKTVFFCTKSDLKSKKKISDRLIATGLTIE